MLCDKILQDPPVQVPTLRFVPDRLARVACRWVETRYRRSERKFEAARSGQHLGSIRPIHPFTGLPKYALRAVSWARLVLPRAAQEFAVVISGFRGLRIMPGAVGSALTRVGLSRVGLAANRELKLGYPAPQRLRLVPGWPTTSVWRFCSMKFEICAVKAGIERPRSLCGQFEVSASCLRVPSPVRLQR